MQLPTVFERYRPEIERELRVVLESLRGPVFDMLRYHLGWVDPEGRPFNGNSGKLIRPSLCLFACEAVSGQWAQALPAAATLELVHNFSLIHDDIQDQDTERRHRLTVWYLWGRGHGINAGNAMAVVGHHALQRLLGCGVSPPRVQYGSLLLATACLEMIEGQCLDLSYENRLDVTEQDYITMIGRKTGALLACSLELGAAVGARDPRDALAFRRCGQMLGLAFQIKDDILGIWGDEKLTGKPLGSDIRRRKKSMPVVCALTQATGKDRKRLHALFSAQKVEEESVAVILDMFDSLRVRPYCERLLSHYCEKARQELKEVRLSRQSEAKLEQVLTFLSERTY